MKSYFTVFCFLILFVAATFTTSFAQINWTKDASNPVMSGGASGTWNRHVFMPSVLYNSDSVRYEMWFSAAVGPNDNNWRPYKIGFATSLDGISWTKHPNPVLVPDVGAWDESTVEGPVVIREDGIYKMWYTGWSPSMEKGGIGYATSSDGISWTKHSGNPVVLPGTGAWEEGGPSYCHVMPVQDGYKMWYTGFNVDFTKSAIGYATSPDGINWTKADNVNPVLSTGTAGQWDDTFIMLPNVLLINDVYCMYFSGSRESSRPRQIGLAISMDGINWIKYNDPVVKTFPGQWDGDYIETGTVMLEGDSLRMWYSGSRYSSVTYLWRIGHATAPVNLINVPGNYVTIQEAIDAAQDGNVVLVDEGTYYENINFKGKAITVASQYYLDSDTSHVSKTIIDGSHNTNPDSGSVVYLVSGEDTTSVLMGFTLTNGTGTKGQYTFAGVKYDFRGGGGIFCENSGGRFVSNKIINNIISVSGDNEVIGGGIYAGDFGSDAWVILEDNNIMNNTVNAAVWGAYGGGVGLTCNGRLMDNDISYNSCTSTAFEANGGGIKITAESESSPRTVIIKGNQITHNFAEGKVYSYNNGSKGGGIVNHYCKVIIIKNDIRYNKLNAIDNGDAYGAGIFMVWAHNESLIGANKIAFNSIAEGITGGGGGIGISRCTVSVINNIIYENFAPNGGGVRFNLSDTEMLNNTIVNNTATSNGGGLYSTASNPVVINTILWGNEAQNNPQISGSVTVRFSDVQGIAEADGNINSDPLFVDTLSYNLSDASPCIGAGKDSIQIASSWYYCPATDYAGHSRPYPKGSNPDMGAMESPLKEPVGIDEVKNGIPLTFALEQNYPNPFNPTTAISYQLAAVSQVDLSIYNILGQKVATLVNKKQPAGNYKVEWDASGFASGVYLYRLETDKGFFQKKKLILLK